MSRLPEAISRIENPATQPQNRMEKDNLCQERSRSSGNRLSGMIIIPNGRSGTREVGVPRRRKRNTASGARQADPGTGFQTIGLFMHGLKKGYYRVLVWFPLPMTIPGCRAS